MNSKLIILTITVVIAIMSFPMGLYISELNNFDLWKGYLVALIMLIVIAFFIFVLYVAHKAHEEEEDQDDTNNY